MKRKDIEEILNPKSIAIVGASSDQRRGATIFLNSLLQIGYEGKIYPVNPNIEVALGIPTYPSILDIPGDVDHVIVGVPARIAPSVVEDAMKKGVKSIHFFTSGFAEVDTEEGRALQKKIADMVRGRARIIGPNCMGIYNPKRKIAFDDGQLPLFGGASFVSQSGGHASYFAKNAIQEGNYCGKVVSIGNSSDLKITDFLEYFSEDEDTDTISMYIEGLANGEGKKFLEILAETAKRKPVIIWKGGQSDQGARAASSHTGAIAADYQLWHAIASQFGAVLVGSMEEMHDFIKIHRLSSPPDSTRACLVTFGGGISVASADACAKAGITLPELTKQTQEALATLMSTVGTIRRNPVDISVDGWQPNVIEKTLTVVGRDPNIDSIIFIPAIGFLQGGAARFGWDPFVVLDHQAQAVVSASQQINIPLICNNPLPFEDIALEELRLYSKKLMEKNKIPTFLTIERTARALKNYHDYHRFVMGGSATERGRA